MRATLRLIVSLIIVMAAVFALSAFLQTRHALGVADEAQLFLEIKRRIWITHFLGWLALSILVSLTTMGVFYLNVTAPIQRTTEWIKNIRLGQAPPEKMAPPKEARFLGPLAHLRFFQ